KVAESEKPGATHIELPEDVMGSEVDAEPLPRRKPVQPEPAARELLRAADLIRGALNPVALAGNGAVRAGAAPALREFVRPAEIDEYFVPEVELVGDIYHVLSRLGEECRHVPHSGGSQRLREVVLGRFEAAKGDDHFPMQPPRALYEIRAALGRDDILVSDV